MKEINSFILYYDWQLLFKNFTLEQKGKLLDSIFNYVTGKISSSDVDINVRDVFDYMITYIDRDKEKYLEKCRKNEENARKRYEKKEEEKKKKTGGFAAYDMEKFEESLNSD